MKERPVSLLVMSILGMVWAGLGLVGTLLGFAMYGVRFGANTPEMEALKHDGVYLLVMFGVGSLNLLNNGVLLAGSIGANKVRAWARPVLFFYCAAFVVIGLMGMAGQIAISDKVMAASMAEATRSGMAMPPWYGTMMRVTTLILPLLFALVQMGWPVYIAVVLTRARVREAFSRG